MIKINSKYVQLSIFVCLLVLVGVFFYFALKRSFDEDRCAWLDHEPNDLDLKKHIITSENNKVAAKLYGYFVKHVASQTDVSNNYMRLELKSINENNNTLSLFTECAKLDLQFEYYDSPDAGFKSLTKMHFSTNNDKFTCTIEDKHLIQEDAAFSCDHLTRPCIFEGIKDYEAGHLHLSNIKFETNRPSKAVRTKFYVQRTQDCHTMRKNLRQHNQVDDSYVMMASGSKESA